MSIFPYFFQADLKTLSDPRGALKAVPSRPYKLFFLLSFFHRSYVFRAYPARSRSALKAALLDHFLTFSLCGRSSGVWSLFPSGKGVLASIPVCVRINLVVCGLLFRSERSASIFCRVSLCGLFSFEERALYSALD